MIIGFHQRFWPMVQDGSKTHTVRGRRKQPVKVGDTMHLFGRVRQPGMFLLLDPPPHCVAVDTIVIYEDAIFFGDGRVESDAEWERLNKAVGDRPWRNKRLEGRDFDGVALHEIDIDECNRFAWQDGFREYPNLAFVEMKGFWYAEHGKDCFPFCGEVLHWKGPKKR